MLTPITNVKVKLIGESGNAFYILGKVRAALILAGHPAVADEYLRQATAGDYDNLLATTMQFVEVE